MLLLAAAAASVQLSRRVFRLGDFGLMFSMQVSTGIRAVVYL
jgi:hypothetical protein